MASVRRLGAAEGLEPPQTAGDIGLTGIGPATDRLNPLTPPVIAPCRVSATRRTSRSPAAVNRLQVSASAHSSVLILLLPPRAVFSRRATFAVVTLSRGLPAECSSTFWSF